MIIMQTNLSHLIYIFATESFPSNFNWLQLPKHFFAKCLTITTLQHFLYQMFSSSHQTIRQSLAQLGWPPEANFYSPSASL